MAYAWEALRCVMGGGQALHRSRPCSKAVRRRNRIVWADIDTGVPTSEPVSFGLEIYWDGWSLLPVEDEERTTALPDWLIRFVDS